MTRRAAKCGLVLAVSTFSSVPVSASGPRLVADINQNSASGAFLLSGPVEVPGTGILVFSARDPANGYELWASSSTAATTELLVDLNPGPQNSSPTRFTAFAGRVYFIATTVQDGRELWSTDGTVGGTRRESDLVPGRGGSIPLAHDLVASGSLLFFPCVSPTQGEELCVHDGSSLQFIDLDFGPGSSEPEKFGAVSSGVCFRATLPATGAEPWCSDGSVAGTELLADLESGAGGSGADHFVALGSGRVIFQADAGQGREPIVAVIATGATTDLDLEAGPSGSSAVPLAATPSGVYLSADVSTSGRELWFYDDSADSVTLLEVRPGSADGFVGDWATFGDFIGFVGDDGVSGQEIWLSSGTVASTLRLPEIVPGIGDAEPRDLLATPSAFFASADDGVVGREVFRITLSSAELYADVQAGVESSDARPLVLAGSGLVVAADPEDAPSNSLFLVADDRGTSALQLSPDVRGTSSGPVGLAPLDGGGVVFSAGDALGREPWTYRGGVAERIDDLNPGSSSSSPSRFVSIGSSVLFTAAFVANEPYLWDGTSVQRVDLNPVGDSAPNDLTRIGDRFVLRATDAGSQRSVYSIDPILPSFEQFAFDAEIASTGDGGYLVDAESLYSTDGTEVGTALITTLSDGPTVLVGALRQPATGAPLLLVHSGDSLWVSDGTEAGTVEVDDDVGPAGLDPYLVPEVFEEGGRGLVVAQYDDRRELYLTDGTVAGSGYATDRASDPAFEPEGVFVLGTVAGGWVLRETRSDGGAEPWFFDGLNPPTPFDLWPGPDGSEPESIGRIGDWLYFWATTPDRGTEMWRTDGGTPEPLAELHPGVASERPQGAVVSGQQIFFSAVGPGGDGSELWAYEPCGVFCDDFESGSVAGWSAAVP